MAITDEGERVLGGLTKLKNGNLVISCGTWVFYLDSSDMFTLVTYRISSEVLVPEELL